LTHTKSITLHITDQKIEIRKCIEPLHVGEKVFLLYIKLYFIIINTWRESC